MCQTHYEDPFYATHVAHCSGSREAPQMYDGLDDYYGCMPLSFGLENKCYQDYPTDNFATPMPIFVDADQNVRCTLVCYGTAITHCGLRAECMILPGQAAKYNKVGVCLYKKR